MSSFLRSSPLIDGLDRLLMVESSFVHITFFLLYEDTLSQQRKGQFLFLVTFWNDTGKCHENNLIDPTLVELYGRQSPRM